MAELTCRLCGCTEARGCRGGCYWVLPDVCSQCAKLQLDAAGVGYDAPSKATIFLNEMQALAPAMTREQQHYLVGALLTLAGEIRTGHAGGPLDGFVPTGEELSQDEIDALYREEHDGPFEETPRLWRPGDPV